MFCKPDSRQQLCHLITQTAIHYLVLCKLRYRPSHLVASVLFTVTINPHLCWCIMLCGKYLDLSIHKFVSSLPSQICSYIDIIRSRVWQTQRWTDWVCKPGWHKWSPRCLWESSQWWSRASISGKLCAGLYGVGTVHKAPVHPSTLSRNSVKKISSWCYIKMARSWHTKFQILSL